MFQRILSKLGLNNRNEKRHRIVSNFTSEMLDIQMKAHNSSLKSKRSADTAQNLARSLRVIR